MDLSPTPDPEYENDELIVLDVIDDPVVADTKAKFTLATAQLQASPRTRVFGERLDCGLEARSHLWMKAAKGLRGSPRDGDPVRHVRSESELFHQVFERNTGFLTRLCGRANVSLVFQRLQGTIEELGRDDDRSTTCTPRGDLDGLSLRGGDVVTLPTAELGQGHGGHDPMVQVVQVVLKR